MQLFCVYYVKIQVHFHIYFDNLIPKYKNYMLTMLILSSVIIVLLFVILDRCSVVNENNIRTMIHLKNFNRKHLYKRSKSRIIMSLLKLLIKRVRLASMSNQITR